MDLANLHKKAAELHLKLAEVEAQIQQLGKKETAPTGDVLVEHPMFITVLYQQEWEKKQFAKYTSAARHGNIELHFLPNTYGDKLPTIPGAKVLYLFSTNSPSTETTKKTFLEYSDLKRRHTASNVAIALFWYLEHEDEKLDLNKYIERNKLDPKEVLPLWAKRTSPKDFALAHHEELNIQSPAPKEIVQQLNAVFNR